MRSTLVSLYIKQVILLVMSTMSQSQRDYMYLRQKILREELQEFGVVNLTDKEKTLDDRIVKLKLQELEKSVFLPARSFLTVKGEIERSKVFQFITKLPKGASLHTHLLAGVSVDYIINKITYMDNVYGCYNDMDVFKMKFLADAKQDGNCSWKSLKMYRKEFAENHQDFDSFLKDTLTLQQDDLKKTSQELWTKFKNIFTTLYDLVAYKPVFKMFVHQLLKELHDDNVFYTELRGTFTPLYELDGTTHDTKVFFDTFIGTVEEFKKNHSTFIGVKYIHSIYRGVDNATLKAGLEQLIYFKTIYPDFIAGFDFVGLEQDGNIVDFHNELLHFAKDLKFFFHAGETNELGKTNLNLVDAILLNSSRIGHGFALAKHPVLLQMARNKNIAIELCPISNQVLQLVQDLRNHPATTFLSKGCPVVICNDDPSVWQATGLSFDWYMVFMSMTWQQHGLGVLKKFARDSITYSAMNEAEKLKAFLIWNQLWDRFIDDMLSLLIVE